MKILCPKCGYRFHVATDELDNKDMFLCTNCTAVWQIEIKHAAQQSVQPTGASDPKLAGVKPGGWSEPLGGFNRRESC